MVFDMFIISIFPNRFYLILYLFSFLLSHFKKLGFRTKSLPAPHFFLRCFLHK